MLSKKEKFTSMRKYEGCKFYNFFSIRHLTHSWWYNKFHLVSMWLIKYLLMNVRQVWLSLFSQLYWGFSQKKSFIEWLAKFIIMKIVKGILFEVIETVEAWKLWHFQKDLIIIIRPLWSDLNNFLFECGYLLLIAIW